MSTVAETRKTVTVLFCDVTGSTELGERLDPEALRRVLLRYWEEMRTILERHGGTVEKFIGDAVMAVFGVPRSHEDDALRAVRAAAEMRERLRSLNEELAETWGVRLSSRIGVNTGDVVAGDAAAGQAIVTGDAVNVAKRLEEAARPGEILIGSATYALVRGAVRAGPLERFPAKGKAEPVGRVSVEHVDPRAAGLLQAPDRPLVGRAAELARLREAFERAVAERSCRLFTLLGDPGLGKSRLARELRASLGDRATTLTGRCLPYGDGITFWPLAQIVRELGGDDGLARALAGTPDADAVAERIRAAIGAPERGGGGAETFWAVRRLLEALARRRPLVVVLEDIHWAEPTFLDLIEYVAGWTRDAPVLLVCLARHQLVEQRPGWLSPRPGADSAALAPLSRAETEALLEGLGGALDPEARQRIAGAAEGNPLFVEQMTAMVAESGDEPLSIPPSIRALLDERLDRLSAVERAVIERASVVGREFWRGAVVDLAPADARDAVGPALMALVRKELIQPEPAELAREDGFRFRHVLVRDAAYDGMPKEVRAELHERYAAWLEQRVGERAPEYEEILGYHLEQAHHALAELGRTGEQPRTLADRAAALLGSAGRRAFARDDAHAAVALLERAVALTSADGTARAELDRELSLALWSAGQIGRAESLLDDVIAAARASGDRRQEWHALLERSGRRRMTDPQARPEEELRLATRAVEVFESLGDELGLARALRAVAWTQRDRCRFDDGREAAERALAHARRAGDAREISRSADALCTCLLYGPTPADEASRRCEEILGEAAGNLLTEANALASLVGLDAMRGELPRARERALRAEQVYADLGLRFALAGLLQVVGPAELLAGDPAAAERALRRAYEILAAIPAKGFTAALLAEALLAQERRAEAAELAAVARETAGAEPATEVMWRALEARLGDDVRLAEEAVAIAASTDALNLHADALVTLAEVGAANRRDGAAEAARLALELYERKGNVAAAAAARTRLSARAPMA